MTSYGICPGIIIQRNVRKRDKSFLMGNLSLWSTENNTDEMQYKSLHS